MKADDLYRYRERNHDRGSEPWMAIGLAAHDLDAGGFQPNFRSIPPHIAIPAMRAIRNTDDPAVKWQDVPVHKQPAKEDLAKLSPKGLKLYWHVLEHQRDAEHVKKVQLNLLEEK